MKFANDSNNANDADDAYDVSYRKVTMTVTRPLKAYTVTEN